MLLNFQRCRAERRDIKNCFYLKKTPKKAKNSKIEHLF